MAARARKNGNPGRTTLPAVGDVNARQRAAQALALRIAGATYEQIAQICGYAGGKASAYKAVQNELQRERAPLIDEARQVELLRLDRYLRICDAKAVKGDLWAIDRCLKIGEARRKLLGLEWSPRPHESAQDQQRMYLIGCHDDGTLPPFPPDVPQPRPGDYVAAISQSVLDAMS